MPGDIRYNLGDAAICLATIGMIREVFSSPEIAVWGKAPLIDGGFEGVAFLERMGIRSLRAILRADLIVWGGGQLLQGNRSRVKIPLWVARIVLLHLAGKRIVGFGQGLGPISRRTDLWLTRLAVSCTDVFTVRDRGSIHVLREARAPLERIHLTADPALALAGLTPGTTRSAGRSARNRTHDSVSGDASSPGPEDGAGKGAEIRPTLGVSLRYTRHHRSGRIIPFQLLPARMQGRVLDSADFRYFLETVTGVCERIVGRLGVDLVLVPMYYAPWETDLVIAEAIERRVRDSGRVRVVRPRKALAEVLNTLGSLDALVATPMHATILATSQYVPTLALHYESKGLDFFSLVGMERWALSVDSLWEPGGPDRFEALIRELWAHRVEIRRELESRMPPCVARANSNAQHLEAVLAAGAGAG